MRKIVAVVMLCGAVLAANAVPARRGWQTRTQADGSTIEVQLLGDEYFHYLVNRDGQQVREVNGMYEVVGEAPTPARVQARRAKARRAPKDFGKTPNLAPRGVVILANFSNKSMASGHTQATFNELFNAENCTVNNGYPSAREYFKSQSNGAYSPQFDVFGPVTLSKSYSYYGNNVGSGDNQEDEYATDAVIEACILANQKYSSLNFADYDSDNDGKVDFVYVVYAGYGEADGGGKSTIWPHNWSIQELVTQYPGSTAYTKSQTRLDGVYLDNYAMSNELTYYNNSLCGIGTLCHEFGHVMGLPDFYDTEYGTNYENSLTPNEWDVMDGGAYNGDGHCPPNYSVWEKYFFGWHTPLNLGADGQNLTLYANGTENYQAYQINASGKLQTATTEGLNYYIENRQLEGWDANLPAAGMLIWYVNYSGSAWENNTPNNTANNPRYTLIIPSGTAIGGDYGTKNVWPYSTKKSWSGVSGKPLLNIAKSGKNITLTYIEEPVIPVDPFDVTFMSNGTQWATTQSTGKLELPDKPTCDCKQFVGWTKTKDYASATTAPTLAAAGDAVAEGATFYAVFATKDGEGTAEQTTTFTFTSNKWADATNIWTSTGDGLAYHSDKQGVQITEGTTGAGAQTNSEMTNVSKIVVKYCTNARNGAGSIKMSVGDASLSKEVNKTGGATLRTLEYTFNKASGKVGIEVTCTTNSIYINSIAVTSGGGVSYSDYSTACSCSSSGVENVAVQTKTRKVIENGQVLILRDGVRYNLLGQPVR